MAFTRYALAAALISAVVAQQPTNDGPNPATTVKDYFKLPSGRTWGSTSAVDIDKDGKSIWVGERCGLNTCLDRAAGKLSNLNPVLKFDSTGKLVTSFGAGLIVSPHGIHVDRDGNVWVTDWQDNAPVAAEGEAKGKEKGKDKGKGPAGPPAGATIGYQVIKFSPDGKVLMKLGKPGGAALPGYFFQPNDVVTAANGDIFVSVGHGGAENLIFKFDKTGKLIKQWGKTGAGPGEFNGPHTLAIDSRNRLIVGDRGNNRIQVFDLDGKFIEQFTQFSRPSGIWVDKNDIIYVADSESGSVAADRTAWKRGIRWGSLKDGKILGFIPDPDQVTSGTSAAEGVAVDAAGNIYGAEVGPKGVKKYVRK